MSVVAPATAVQSRPFALQRSHAYLSAAGIEVQVAASAFRPCPTIGSPLSGGCFVATGAAPGAATSPASGAYAVVVPVLSVARTLSPIVWPTSFRTSVYVPFVAPWIELQCAPFGSHRYH